MRKRIVASSKLEAGDVFKLVNPPEDVRGEVFWKHHKTGAIRRMKLVKGECRFEPVTDLPSNVFFMTDFKRSKVRLISKYQPQNKADKFLLSS